MLVDQALERGPLALAGLIADRDGAQVADLHGLPQGTREVVRSKIWMRSIAVEHAPPDAAPFQL